jgi:hypothetical protein
MPRRRFSMLSRAGWRLYPHIMARTMVRSERRPSMLYVDARRRWAYDAAP